MRCKKVVLVALILVPICSFTSRKSETVNVEDPFVLRSDNFVDGEPLDYEGEKCKCGFRIETKGIRRKKGGKKGEEGWGKSTQ